MEGRVIGQYRVTGILGEGGMGVVYAAEHTLLDRPAAVKVLLPRLSGEQEIVTRFFNEARAATAIRHPGIVEVYDFGWTSDGAAFLVMEYLQGETLRARRKRAPMRWSTSLAIVRQIAGALEAAHAKKIIHRDLKPDNIFLVPDPEVPGGERIKLLDFGIAKLAGAVSSRHQTQTGTVMGTPPYMAPEQCRGVAVDARADLYALGCILFELCTGRPPFLGEGTGDVLAAHIHQPPPKISSLASGVPREVEALVARLLVKSPADRVQTAHELIRMIDAARAEISQIASSGQHPIAVAVTEPSIRDAPTDVDHREPEKLTPGSTVHERASARRSRRDAIATTLPPGDETDAMLGPPAFPISSRPDTTLSSAAGTHQQAAVRAPARRWRILGTLGALATAGAIAATLLFILTREDEEPVPAAASSLNAESLPSPTVPLSPNDTVAPSPPVVPIPPPAASPPASVPAPTPAPASDAPAPPAPTPALAPDPPVPPAPTPDAPNPPESATKSAPVQTPSTPPSPSVRGTEPRAPASHSRATQVTITIQSSPSGAAIYRGDTFFGTTPQDLKLERGDYAFKLELRLPGWQSQEIIVHPTGTTRKNVTLKRAPRTPSQPTPPPSQQSSSSPPQQQPSTPPSQQQPAPEPARGINPF